MTSLRSVLHGARLLAGVFVAAAGLGGCALMAPQTSALGDAWPPGLPERIELVDVPFFPQQDYQCGPAALATTLGGFKRQVTPELLVPQVYLPARQGSLQIEMLATPRRYDMVSYQLAPSYADLLREVAAGTPVIVLQDYGVWPVPLWHYAVVVGYDYPKGEMVLRSGEKRRLLMPLSVLEYTWKGSNYWAMVNLPPDRIPVTATETTYLAAVVAMGRVATAQAATTAFATFLGRWPDNLTAHIGLANGYHAMGELQQAEAVLRQAALRHPESAAVRNNLAQTVSDQGRNDEALALIEAAALAAGPYAEAARDTRDLIRQRIALNGGRAAPFDVDAACEP